MRRPARDAGTRRYGYAAAASAAVGLTVGWGTVLATADARWYAGLLKPTFAPPPWWALAGAIVVAIAAARALFRVLCRPDHHPDRRGAIRLFLSGLGLAALWSWMFFAGRHPNLALAVAALAVAVSALTALRFTAVDRRAGLLLLPWTVATLFVFLLDLSIASRNG